MPTKAKKIYGTASPLFERKLTRNAAGGKAYAYDNRHLLAQVAATGMFGAQPWGEDMVENLVQMATDLGDPEFVAKAALWARKRGHIKDAPALLCATLAHLAPEAFRKVAPQVLDNGRMVRGLVGYLRRGGKAMPTCARKFVKDWFRARSAVRLLNDSVGSSGGEMSLADVIRLVHPKPKDVIQGAVLRYLLGKDMEGHEELLPPFLKDLQAFQRSPGSAPMPRVDFRLLTSMPLSTAQWTTIALQGGWQMVRMNLNTFARHGVFGDAGVTRRVADKLRDPKAIAESRVLPFQLLTSHQYLSAEVPQEIRQALVEATEIAVSNIPPMTGKIYVCVDISGSTHDPIRVSQGRSSTTCLDVAALAASSIARLCPQAKIIPFHDSATTDFVARRTILETTQALKDLPDGGTDCSAPLKTMKGEDAENVAAIIYLSDNESWISSEGSYRGTETLHEWDRIRKSSPSAKLICIDINPRGTTSQAPDKHGEILNIGGFSDAVFTGIRDFIETGRSWVQMIDSINLEKGLDFEDQED